MHNSTSNYLAFPLLIEKTLAHFEKVENHLAWLVINGKSKDNEKIAFYLSFEKVQRWLMDTVRLEPMADYNQYLKEANCSRQYLDELRFKEMMA